MSVGLDINRINPVATTHGMPTVSSPWNKVAHHWWAAEWRVAPSLWAYNSRLRSGTIKWSRLVAQS